MITYFGGPKTSWDSLCRVSFLQTGTKLLKLLLLLHRQFLHGGTTSCCIIPTPVDSNEEDLAPHTLQIVQIWYRIIVVYLLEEHTTDPLLIISKNNNDIYSYDIHW